MRLLVAVASAKARAKETVRCQRSLLCKVLPQDAVGEMVSPPGAVFLSPFGSTAIVFIMKEVVFGFFPVDRPAKPFAHIPLVFIDGMAVLPNLPFIKIQMGLAAV